jgi:hypothetical protein
MVIISYLLHNELPLAVDSRMHWQSDSGVRDMYCACAAVSLYSVHAWPVRRSERRVDSEVS